MDNGNGNVSQGGCVRSIVHLIRTLRIHHSIHVTNVTRRSKGDDAKAVHRSPRPSDLGRFAFAFWDT